VSFGVGEPEQRSRAITGRGLAIGVLTPVAAAVGSIPFTHGGPVSHGPASAIALFMLAIVIAAVAGGLWSGLIAALLSSLAIPLLLSNPRFTLKLVGTQDVVTAVVFLAVALVVGLLVGSASEERARASRSRWPPTTRRRSCSSVSSPRSARRPTPTGSV